jgi:hypothetical protein
MVAQILRRNKQIDALQQMMVYVAVAAREHAHMRVG